MCGLEPEHKAIYERLQDDESRELFMCRYKYFKDGDYEHLWDELDVANKYYKLSKTNTDVKDVWDLIENDDLCSRGVVLFGAGIKSGFCLKLLAKKKLEVKALCDSDVSKQGQVVGAYSIMPPEKISTEYCDIPIIITPARQDVKDEMHELLLRLGVPRQHIFYFRAITEKQYFGPEFITPLPNEVYIDGGCYDGETIMDFLEFARTGKVYGFEPNPDCYAQTIETLHKNNVNCVKMFQKGLWDGSETLKFDMTHRASSQICQTGSTQIKTISIDEAIDSLDNITFIKMDVEGAELHALKGSKKTIRHCLPRLAICIYHKPEDIVDIPGYILSISQDYKLYIRHHVPWVNNETVLYAIP